MLAPGIFLLPAVLLWAWGYDGFVVIHLLCLAGRVVVSGGIGLGEYGKCIMQFGFGFGVKQIFSLLLPVTVIYLSLSFSPSTGIPVHHQSSPDLLPLLAYPPNSAENLWHGLNATLSLLQINLKQ